VRENIGGVWSGMRNRLEFGPLQGLRGDRIYRVSQLECGHETEETPTYGGALSTHRASYKKADRCQSRKASGRNERASFFLNIHALLLPQ